MHERIYFSGILFCDKTLQMRHEIRWCELLKLTVEQMLLETNSDPCTTKKSQGNRHIYPLHITRRAEYVCEAVML
jgi:hypothetical protein